MQTNGLEDCPRYCLPDSLCTGFIFFILFWWKHNKYCASFLLFSLVDLHFVWNTTPLRRTQQVSVLITYPVSSSVGTSRTMGRFSVGWPKHWCFPPLIHITLPSFKKFSLLPLLPPLVNRQLKNHEWSGWRTKTCSMALKSPMPLTELLGAPHSLVFNPLLSCLCMVHSAQTEWQRNPDVVELWLTSKKAHKWTKSEESLKTCDWKKQGNSLSLHFIFRNWLIACILFPIWEQVELRELLKKKSSFKYYNFNNWTLS